MAAKHPPFPPEWNHDMHAGTGLIHVHEALSADASASRLDPLIKAKVSSETQKALREAKHALFYQAIKHIRHATAWGLLLMCWHGTKALEPQQ